MPWIPASRPRISQPHQRGGAPGGRHLIVEQHPQSLEDILASIGKWNEMLPCVVLLAKPQVKRLAQYLQVLGNFFVGLMCLLRFQVG